MKVCATCMQIHACVFARICVHVHACKYVRVPACVRVRWGRAPDQAVQSGAWQGGTRVARRGGATGRGRGEPWGAQRQGLGPQSPAPAPASPFHGTAAQAVPALPQLPQQLLQWLHVLRQLRLLPQRAPAAQRGLVHGPLGSQHLLEVLRMGERSAPQTVALPCCSGGARGGRVPAQRLRVQRGGGKPGPC